MTTFTDCELGNHGSFAQKNVGGKQQTNQTKIAENSCFSNLHKIEDLTERAMISFRNHRHPSTNNQKRQAKVRFFTEMRIFYKIFAKNQPLDDIFTFQSL